MARVVLVVACILMALARPLSAGENSAGKLAMHLVASEQYLYCPDLLPASCEEINCDLSVAELEASNGYGYLAFIAYDFTAVQGAEFAVAGFPSGRGGPTVQGPYWCPSGTLTMGDFLDEGGIMSGDCLEPHPVSGLAVLGYLQFRHTGEDPLYIEYAPSTFSHPLDPYNSFLDCTVDHVEDDVTYETGCVIKGEALDGPLCGGGGEGADGGEGGGGLVWAMRVPLMSRRDFVDQYLDEDLRLLPGREFPLPDAPEVLVNRFVESGMQADPRRRFPLRFIRIKVKGEPTWSTGANQMNADINYEWYVGFLPVSPDGAVAEEGVDWWSWELGRPMTPGKWVQPRFEWNTPTQSQSILFSSGTLSFEGADESEAVLHLPFEQGYVAAYDVESRRLAVAGYDQVAGDWHVVVLDERGQVLFQNPWDTPPSTHLHSCDGGATLVYAVWEDEATTVSRPIPHPIPSGSRGGPPILYRHPALGGYQFSLRTGRVTKIPSSIHRPGAPPGHNARAGDAYSLDGRYLLRPEKSGRHASMAYYNIGNPLVPIPLWNRWEGRLTQRSAVSAAGEYVAQILFGSRWPEGPDGPAVQDTRVTLRLRNKEGLEIGSLTVPMDQMPRFPLVFSGDYLFVGYDGTLRHDGPPGYMYIFDMKEPWSDTKGVIGID